MACEELGEMPELDVGALLEKHGLVEYPQVGMLNERKRVSADSAPSLSDYL